MTPKDLSVISTAARQYATRPDDERFPSLDALEAHVRDLESRSAERKGTVGEIEAVATEGGGIVFRSKTGAIATPTYRAFGQYCTAVGADGATNFLRSIPADLAAENLRVAAKMQADPDATIDLYTRAEQGAGGEKFRSLLSVLGSRYTRVTNTEVVRVIRAMQDRAPGLDLPQEFRRPLGAPSKVVPTAFAGEDDVFVMLADYTRTFRVGNRDLTPGVIISNSTTGSMAFTAHFFAFDWVCCNANVWGASTVSRFSLRHVGDMASKVKQIWEVSQKFLDTPASVREEQGRAAQAKLLAPDTDAVIESLRRKGFGLRDSQDAVKIAESTPDYGDPRSVFAIVGGLTEVAQGRKYAAARLDLETKAGALYSMAF